MPSSDHCFGWVHFEACVHAHRSNDSPKDEAGADAKTRQHQRQTAGKRQGVVGHGLVPRSDVAVILLQLDNAFGWVRVVAVAMRADEAIGAAKLHFAKAHGSVAVETAPALVEIVRHTHSPRQCAGLPPAAAYGTRGSCPASARSECFAV